jgi:hypothetical protein
MAEQPIDEEINSRNIDWIKHRRDLNGVRRKIEQQ